VTEPLLVLQRARIDAGGAVVFDGISVATRGDQVGLVGAWDPLFDWLGGRARLTSGSARIRGLEPHDALDGPRLGLALADTDLPDAWTALDYLIESAKLAGVSAHTAHASARSALAGVGFAHLEGRRIGTLTLAEKRVLSVAHAALGSPLALAVQAPLAGLDSQGAELVAEALMRAGAGRGLLVSVPAPAPVGAERALLDRLGEVLVLEAGVLIAHGSPDEALTNDARYAVTVTRLGTELSARLGEIGVTATLAQSASPSTRARLIVELGAGKTTDDLLDAALAVGAPIIELIPLEAGSKDAASR
jgi:ABC-type multidrug transport system ATPase subunit